MEICKNLFFFKLIRSPGNGQAQAPAPKGGKPAAMQLHTI